MFNKYGLKYIVIFVFVKFVIFFKEVFFLKTYSIYSEYQYFLFAKPTFDLVLLFSSSVFYLERLIKNKEVTIPFWQFLVFLFIGIIISVIDKGLDRHFIYVYLIIFSSAICSTFSNSIVVLAKEYGSSKLNFLVNSSENYFILFIILINHKISFIHISFLTILIQFIISFIGWIMLKKEGFQIRLAFSFNKQQLNIMNILSSSFIILILILSRYFYELNKDIGLKNFSLLIASSIMLIIERYIEYSSVFKRGETFNLITYKFSIFLLICFGFGFFMCLLDLGIYHEYLLVIYNFFKYLFLFCPIVFFFIIFRLHSFFSIISVGFIIVGFLVAYYSSFINKSDAFLCISSFLTVIYFLYANAKIK